MAYTVRQVARMSRVSVRTLHYYDEAGVLKPAYVGANGYRFYEEPQLLMLQQILFYRELGFELKRIKRVLGRRDFEKVAALRSHRKVMEQDLARKRTLIATIDKTINHLKGKKKMKNEDMFAGFSVKAGQDRYGESETFHGEAYHCKVSGRDTDGRIAIFETTAGWPRHLHHEQDEWIYVIDGEVVLEVGEKRSRVAAGESVFIPRNVPHVWGVVPPGKVLNVYQPAGRIEEFYRRLPTFRELPTREQVMSKSYTEQQTEAMIRFFAEYGMKLLGPPLVDV